MVSRTQRILNARPQEAPDAREVARLAYGLYEQRGHAHGRDREDWYLAETMLKNRNPALAWLATARRSGR